MVRVLYLIGAIALGAGSALADPVTSKMLVEMRDITSVSASPDGNRAVVGLLSPDATTNRRSLSWVIVSLDSDSEPIVVPGGEAFSTPSGLGLRLDVRAVWSSNGDWFYYLRLNAGEIQLWETDAKGKHTQQMTHSPGDLIDVAASTDPSRILVRVAPARSDLDRAERADYERGILYGDALFPGTPVSSDYPSLGGRHPVRRTASGEFYPAGWSGAVDQIIDISKRPFQLSPTNAKGADALSRRDAQTLGVSVVALGHDTTRDYIYRGFYRLSADPDRQHSSAIECEAADCVAAHLTVLGWSKDRTEVMFLSDSGTRGTSSRLPGRTTLFGWTPANQRVRRLTEFGGRFYNVQQGGSAVYAADGDPSHPLVGAFTDADQPPRVETVDVVTGRRRVVFDPNVDLRRRTQGRTQWIQWSAPQGDQGRGILVLPDSFEPGKRYPLVITSYLCSMGLLRGGDHDNAPEFVLASHGIASVCMDVAVADLQEKLANWSLLYPVLCDRARALLSDPRLAGMIDPARVGLSGHSMGGNFGTYCISHSSFIAAAAFRHGSFLERPSWQLFYTAAWLRDPVTGFASRYDLPDPRNDPQGRWAEVSSAERAAQIRSPLLLEVDDSEYLDELPLWSAMRDAKRPVEMFVFPKETHVLYQPVHQLANFERQVDWFDFWLNGHIQDDEGKQAEIERWTQLRALNGREP